MQESNARHIIIEHLENRYQKPYTETCLGSDFDLKFISSETSGEKCKHRSTWIASFFLDLTDFESRTGTEFFPISIEIYLDDETREIWVPVDPNKKPTAREKRDARKERRQVKYNGDF